jgi:hypothetical protein
MNAKAAQRSTEVRDDWNPIPVPVRIYIGYTCSMGKHGPAAFERSKSGQ